MNGFYNYKEFNPTIGAGGILFFDYQASQSEGTLKSRTFEFLAASDRTIF